MLKVYGFSKVNAVARGNTRDLRVLWALEDRCQMALSILRSSLELNNARADVTVHIQQFSDQGAKFLKHRVA